jgi:integrase
MNHGKNNEWLRDNRLATIKANYKPRKAVKQLSLSPEQLPELMATIAQANIKLVTRCLIEFQLHTATRPSEAAGARWCEIDWENFLWMVPKWRMKMGEPHDVPLTKQTLNILQTLRPITGHREHIFPGDHDPTKPSNSQTANMALKRAGLGGKQVAHGFRALFSTTCNEANRGGDAVEAALAHGKKDKIVAAYNRAKYLEQRRDLMAWWSAHVERAAIGNLSVAGRPALKLKVVA